MTRDEFHEWLEYHGAAFPGLREWLEDQPDAQKVQQHWFNALRASTSRSAHTATDEMVQGRIAEVAFGKHRGTILARCRELDKHSLDSNGTKPQPRLIEGEWAYECLRCQDAGFVLVWRTPALEHYQKLIDAGKKNIDFWIRDVHPGHDYGLVRCCCEYGSRISRHLPQYKPEQHRIRIEHPEKCLDSLLNPDKYRNLQ